MRQGPSLKWQGWDRELAVHANNKTDVVAVLADGYRVRVWEINSVCDVLHTELDFMSGVLEAPKGFDYVAFQITPAFHKKFAKCFLPAYKLACDFINEMERGL